MKVVDGRGAADKLRALGHDEAADKIEKFLERVDPTKDVSELDKRRLCKALEEAFGKDAGAAFYQKLLEIIEPR